MTTLSVFTEVALSSTEDFTTQTYRQLLRLAKKSYDFCLYKDIPWGQKFVVWRHDCDLSLNRAYALAKIEAEEGICATYFLNPHCEFYNIFEKSQHALVLEILEMGHEIGLHYDAAFFDSSDESSLNYQVSEEASILERLYGVRPTAFSFHNPSSENLICQADSYGGLINCYSKKFRDNVPYCSDSNGYWRHRRLDDVLKGGADSCLQVLIHPDWWQDSVMPPRQRIFRSIYGRAASLMKKNDALLDAFDRPNLGGAAENLRFLKEKHSANFEFCDFLWNAEHFRTLFLELLALHDRQILNLSKVEIIDQWKVSAHEVSAFFDSQAGSIDELKVFEKVFGFSLYEVINFNREHDHKWVHLRREGLHFGNSVTRQRLEELCIILCQCIASLGTWGQKRTFGYDGLSSVDALDALNLRVVEGNRPVNLDGLNFEAVSVNCEKWIAFKSAIEGDNSKSLFK